MLVVSLKALEEEGVIRILKFDCKIMVEIRMQWVVAGVREALEDRILKMWFYNGPHTVVGWSLHWCPRKHWRIKVL